ncbi:MAG: SH3 domain-containing protein [Candidatus Limnocylindria bacterium]
MGKLRGGIGVLLATVIGACTLPPLETGTPTPSPSPSATPSPSPTGAPTPDPTPSPTPASTVPDFAAGEIVVTATDGLRVRSLPGLQRPVVTGLLPVAARLEVVMGPIRVEERGWYLVRDHDPAEPSFEEGWVAAGFEPDPLLASTGSAVDGSPSIASMDGTSDAEQGPIEIGDGEHLIRWIAVDPERARCAFAVSLTPVAGGDPRPAIRATIGTGVDRGVLQPQSFAALAVRGPVFVAVISDCGWALVIQRAPPPESPSPSAS